MTDRDKEMLEKARMKRERKNAIRLYHLFHEGKITEKEVVSFEKQVGDRWFEFYYG